MIRDSNFHQSGISVWPQGDTLKCLLVFALSSHFGVLLYSESKPKYNLCQSLHLCNGYPTTIFLFDRWGSFFILHTHRLRILSNFGRVRDRQAEGRRNIPTRKFMNPGRRSYFGAGRFFFKSILDTLTVAVSYWITLQPYSASLCLPGLQKGQIK